MRDQEHRMIWVFAYAAAIGSGKGNHAAHIADKAVEDFKARWPEPLERD